MRSEKGFVLLLAVILLFLASGLVVVIYVDLMGSWNLTRDFEAQLYSQTLAENGIEYALAVLPHLNLKQLLPGEDGTMGSPVAEWRNPLGLREARLFDPDRWVPECDDGLPFAVPYRLSCSGRGTTIIRFSNNPEEKRGLDRDDVILVRSLGIVPAVDGGLPFSLDVNNHTSLVEARLRQERVFEAPSPVMLAASSGRFDLSCTDLKVISEESPAIVCISLDRLKTVKEDLLSSLEGCHGALQSPEPTLVSETENYARNSRYQRLFSKEFWKHFRDRIPYYSENSPGQGHSDSLVWSGHSLDFTGSFRGILISEGRLNLRNAKIDGLLIHLGEEELSLEGSTRLRGALWMFDLSLIVPSSPGIHLTVRDSVEIIYDAEAIQRVLPLFPATLLEWRLLFPEMEDSDRARPGSTARSFPSIIPRESGEFRTQSHPEQIIPPEK